MQIVINPTNLKVTMRINPERFERIIKFSTFLSFILLIINLAMILLLPQLTGYELSVYGILPLPFWLIMAITILFGISLVVISALCQRNYWIYGVLLILLNYCILFFLGSIRGYQFLARYGYDLFEHLGTAGAILNTGHIPNNVFYPITHIIILIFNLIGFPVNFGVEFISFIFFIALLFSSFILGKSLFDGDNYASLFILLCALPLTFSFLHVTLLPFFLGFTMLFFLLYTVYRIDKAYKKLEFLLLFIILTVLIVFFHPMIAIFSMVILAIFEIFSIIRKLFFPYLTFKMNVNFKSLFAITAVIFSFWYFSFALFTNSLKQISDSVFEIGKSAIGRQSSIIQESGASLTLIIERFIKVYGSISLYLILGTFCVLFVIKRIIAQKATLNELIFSFQFICCSTISILLFISYFVIREPVRLSSISILMAILLIGITLFNISTELKSFDKRIFLGIFLLIFISLASILSIFNLYASPWTGTPSPDMTKMESNGVNWYWDNSDREVTVFLNSDPISSYFPYYNTIIKDNTDIRKPPIIQYDIPSHFGYDQSNSVSRTFNENNFYLIFREIDKENIKAVPASLQSNYPIYSDNDIMRLNYDHSINKLYSNDQFKVYQARKKS